MCFFDLNAPSSRSNSGKTVEQYLKHRGVVPAYLNISAKVQPQDPNFQSSFSSLYGLNAAHLTNNLKNNFYNIFDDYFNHRKYVSYRFILEDLKDKTIGTNRLEVSFGSKLLHTIDSDEPIIDNEVITKLCICSCTARCFSGVNKKPKTIDSAVDLHNALKACYVNYLIPLAKQVDYFSQFDNAFPAAAHISEVKKIDFYLWAM